MEGLHWTSHTWDCCCHADVQELRESTLPIRLPSSISTTEKVVWCWRREWPQPELNVRLLSYHRLWQCCTFLLGSQYHSLISINKWLPCTWERSTDWLRWSVPRISILWTEVLSLDNKNVILYQYAKNPIVPKQRIWNHSVVPSPGDWC